MIANGEDRTDWERIRNMADNDIDFSDIPELDEAFWENAEMVIPETEKLKKSVTIPINKDVLNWFKSHSKDYRVFMGAVLKAFVDKQKIHSGKASK
jgi:uncharacterized protein (DUF4415 family)